MEVHFWDMDGTLVDGDVDTSWKAYLIEKGVAPPEAQAKTDFFYEQYCRGELDQTAFSRFQHAEFVGRDYATMAAMSRDHFAKHIRSLLYPSAVKMLRRQQGLGLPLVLLTATSRELSEPVAEYLGLADLLATNLERVDGRYTGEVAGVYCGGIGKVGYIQSYVQARGSRIEDAYYYGDSVADIPVFEAVGHPVVCNPGDALRRVAAERGWRVLNFASPEPGLQATGNR